MVKMIELDKVMDVEFDGIDHRDAPDYADAFISSASYVDNGIVRELTEDEKVHLETHHAAWVYEKLQNFLH